MEYVYAALLLHKVQQEINEDNVKKVLTATGAKPDDVKVKALVAALDGVDIEEALKTTTVQAAAPAAAAPAAEGESKGEEKKEEKEEKPKEEALEGLSSLFG
ncbi:MAG: 50S ribosomal protein P1 [Thermoproteota archaeon]